jgi:hypothetical protein
MMMTVTMWHLRIGVVVVVPAAAQRKRARWFGRAIPGRPKRPNHRLTVNRRARVAVDEDMAATAPTRATVLEVGSALLAPSTQGPAGPAGTAHLVEGWEPVCGGERVRFVFPGREVDPATTCPECTQAVAVAPPVPRQRRTTTTPRSRPKAV